MGLLLVADRVGEGRLNQKRPRPVMTACVAGDFHSNSTWQAGRSALRMRPRGRRSALGFRRPARQPTPLPTDKGRVWPKTESRSRRYTKKVRSACWKAAMGQGSLGKAAWRWARVCAAGRCSAGSVGGGQRPSSAVRILLWARSKRFQMRCQVRLLRCESLAPVAGRMPPPAACWRNCHSRPVVRLRRRILSASQTLKVRPQPRRAWRLLQKIRRVRHGLSLRAAVVKAVQEAVANQRTDDPAVRTSRLLEPFGHGVPFLVAAVKPSFLAHHAPAKIAILREGEERGSGVRFAILERGAGSFLGETAFVEFPV